MRLDRFLAQLNMGTRSEVKNLVRKGAVTVNGFPATSPEQKIDENKDTVVCNGKVLRYREHVYYMMNKQGGVVTATKDKAERTVLEVLFTYLPEQDRKRELVPAGRLDKDTEGLLLLTDDGALIHELLSPKKHVDKTYLVETAKELSQEMIAALEIGVDIGDEKKTLPAKAELLSAQCLQLTIHEGRYHQVKRMLQAVDNQVTALKRIRFGPLTLDEKLAPGECRELTEAEIEALRTCAECAELSGKKASQYKNKSNREDEVVPCSRASCGSAKLTSYNSAALRKINDIEAVIFDLDGTLVDSMWMWKQIDIEYLGRYNIPLPEKLQSSIEGMSFHETAVYFKEHFQIPETLEEIKDTWNRMAWDKYANEVPLKPGVRTFLDRCKERGIKLGIATSNSRELVQNVAVAHGLHDYFECIKTGCDVIKGKPAPDIYLAVAEELEVEPSHCLVFEDVVPGIQAGKSAGMRVCAVEDLYSAEVREKKRALADYYIEDYSEVSAWMEI